MATAKLTLIGMYNYDDTLFDKLSLPSYFDKDTLINTILLAGGEFGCLYPAGDFMKNAIGLWSAKNQRYFERLALLMSTDYEPLENYNRREHWTDTGSSENNTDGNSSGRTTENSTTHDTTTGQVSAFNSSEFENRDKSTLSGSETNTGTSTNTFEQSGQYEYANERDGYARGNIGVMSSQDMFKQELEVVSLSPYDLIAGDFINEFCVKLYE